MNDTAKFVDSAVGWKTMEEMEASRDLLTRVCLSEGFPAPRNDQGLIAWEDEALNASLAPRGGPSWQRAQAWVVDALEAAIHGDERLVRNAIRQALAIIREEGRRECACPVPACPKDDGYGRTRCARCHGRVTPNNPARSPS